MGRGKEVEERGDVQIKLVPCSWLLKWDRLDF
jgi:hypothetical protein